MERVELTCSFEEADTEGFVALATELELQRDGENDLPLYRILENDALTLSALVDDPEVLQNLFKFVMKKLIHDKLDASVREVRCWCWLLAALKLVFRHRL